MRKLYLFAVLGALWLSGAYGQGLVRIPQEQYLTALPNIRPIYDRRLRFDGEEAVETIFWAGNTDPCRYVFFDQSTGTQYLALTNEFTATPFSPVVYRKGLPVGRAFERKADSTYDFLICETSSSTLIHSGITQTVYMRRDLWEEYYREYFIIKEAFERRDSIEFNIVHKDSSVNVERKAISYVNLEKDFVSRVVEEFAQLYKMQVEKRKAELDNIMTNGNVEPPEQSAEEFLGSSVLVDGVYYAPYGSLDTEGKSSEAGAVFDSYDLSGIAFKNESKNGVTVPKYIVVEEQPYIAMPWWQEILGFETYHSLEFNNWLVVHTDDRKRWPSDAARLSIALTPPAQPPKYQLAALKASWVSSLTRPTQQVWTEYLKKAIRINGVPALPLAVLADMYPLVINGNKVMEGSQVVATLFDPALPTPAVRLNGETYIPVTLLSGVQYNQKTNQLTVPHSKSLQATVSVSPLALKTYSVAELKRLEAQRVEQQRQAAAKQAQIAQQKAQAAQKAAQQASAAAARQAAADAAATARLQQALAAARKAAPGMTVLALGNNLFGGYKVKDNKLFVRILQVNNAKVVASCDQQSLDKVLVLRVLGATGNQGVLTLAVSSPGAVVRASYAFRPNSRYCAYTAQ